MAYHGTRLDTFHFFCQNALPLVYDDSLSYYEVLCKLVDYINELLKDNREMERFLKQTNIRLDELNEKVKILNDILEKVKNGEYVKLYLDILKKYIDENLQEFVGRIVKFIFFQLDDSGRFNAIIPSAWDFIEFETPIDPEYVNYLHLILKY